MEQNFYTLFSVPLIQAIHPQQEALNTELRTLILSREAAGTLQSNESPSMKIPKNLFESRFDFFNSPEPCVRALQKFCLSWLVKSIGELSGYDAKTLSQLSVNTHTWFHVTRKGGYFALHNHPMASWSGVYCVDPGNSEDADTTDGAISFLNPMGIANMFVDAGNSHLKAPFSGKNFSMQLRAGELILFPSYLLHQVLPYYGTTERITVAFNCWFNLPAD